MQLLTIILNWRTPEMTLQATEAALAALAGVAGAITIVDNDSQDGSYEKLCAAVAARGWDRAAHPVRVLQSGKNGGFGAGNNFGIRAGLPDGSAPDFIYILNSDAFPEVGAIAALLDYMARHPAVGIAGSLIIDETGTPVTSAFRFPSVLGEFEAQARSGPISRLLKHAIVALPPEPRDFHADWLVGASLILRARMLAQIGLFDETFFLYFEETDLCRRAARAGWDCVHVAQSRVMHIGSVSTGMGRWQRVPGFWLDSRLHYFRKNHGRFYAALCTLAAVSGGLIWRLRALIQRRERHDPDFFLSDMVRHHLRHGFVKKG